MNEDTADSNAEYIKLVPWIWTALRLLGVYVVIIGFTAAIDDAGTVIVRQIKDAERMRLSSDDEDTLTPRLVADAVWTVAGLYLLFGGRWLVENAFLPANVAHVSNNDENDTEAA